MLPELEDPLDFLATFDFEGHDEQSIRDQWISVLLRLLGYGLEGTIMLPKVLKLRAPLQKLGSHSRRLDYAPTVHRVGLWIMEAKHPSENPFSEAHLGQAWWYATDPRVNVPLIVMTNGRRIGVFDLGEETWDEPSVDLEHSELPHRFDELRNAIGARQVAEYVRRRQLEHLGKAMRAQIDEAVLEDTKRVVERLCEEARPEIRRNRSALWFRAYSKQQKSHQHELRTLGAEAFAQFANSAYVVVGGDIDECVEMIREMTPVARADALEGLRQPRTMFGLRVLQLAVALRLVDDPEVGEEAKRFAEESVRNHVNHFADDPLEAAAHAFEMALVPFVARVTIKAGASHAVSIALSLEKNLEPHEFVTRDAKYGLQADAITGSLIDAAVRRVWNTFEPWSPEALLTEARRLRAFAEEVGPQTAVEPGQIGDRHMDLRLRHDPLVPATGNIVTEVAESGQLSESVTSFAKELLETYFPDDA